MKGIKLTKAQNQVLDKMANHPWPAPPTAEELGASIVTMQALKSKGLIKNVQRFGDDEVIGKERQTIRWVFAPIRTK